MKTNDSFEYLLISLHSKANSFHASNLPHTKMYLDIVDKCDAENIKTAGIILRISVSVKSDDMEQCMSENAILSYHMTETSQEYQ